LNINKENEMNINELKIYVKNTNPYNFPVSILEDKFITNDQMRIDLENGKYKLSSLNEKAHDDSPLFFDDEEKAVALFKKMWDAGIKSYEYDLEDRKKL
jgi:hypothetical protein